MYFASSASRRGTKSENSSSCRARMTEAGVIAFLEVDWVEAFALGGRRD